MTTDSTTAPQSGDEAAPLEPPVTEPEPDELDAEPGCLLLLWQSAVYLAFLWGWIHLVGGTLLRLTIRDRVPYLATIFYASPAIVLAALAAVLSVREWRLDRKRVALVLLASAPVYAVWWHMTTDVANPVPPPPVAEEIRVVFWNISYVDAGWPAIIEQIKQEEADVIGLVEVGGGYPEVMRLLRTEFPDYDVRFVRLGMLMIRGRWTELERGMLERHGEVAWGRGVLADGRELDAVLVDIYGFPLMPRGPAFRELDYIVTQLALEKRSNTVVMGDFNTPPDSIFFEPLRRHFDNAFEVAGDGYHVTWPVVAPVLGLDQIWVSRGQASRCKFLDTPHSDHRLVRASFRSVPH